MDTSNLAALVEHHATLIGELDRLTFAMKSVNERIREIEESLIPDLMDELGIEKTKLANGVKVDIVNELTASVSKDRMPAVIEELRRQNADDMIKADIVAPMGKGADAERIRAVMALLQDAGCESSCQRSVNTATLKAWLRRRIEDGQPTDLELFGAHLIRKAKIKQ